ncbi:MAG: electron transfer flavoprotein subunit beta/FixA family protein [Thermotaleaceae bacterium]
MRIIVCIKQVPSTNEVRLHPVHNTIMRDGRQSVTNPFDTYATEQAIQIKEQQNGEVIALSMGIPATERLLRDAVSRGVDRSMLLSDPKFAGADTLATAYTLSLGIREIGDFDLILCGKMAVDGDTAQIGPELAENLGIPHITDVCEFMRVSKAEIVCKKITDYGHQILKVKLPALITVVKDINMPRLPSIEGVLSSLSAPFEIRNANVLKADEQRIGLTGSPTQVVKTYVPQRQREAIELQGDEERQAELIGKLLGEVLENDRIKNR